MGCVMCDRTSIVARDELTTAEVLRVCGEASAMGVREVILFGGEPTVREDLAHLVHGIRTVGMKAFLVSNGWNLDSRLAHRLVSAGLSGARLALEAASAEEHDRIRGRRGSFVRTWEALHRLRDAADALGRSLSLATHTVILRQNYLQLPDLIAMLVRSRLRLEEFVITPFIPSATTLGPDGFSLEDNRRHGLGRDEVRRFNLDVAPALLDLVREAGFTMPRERVCVFGESDDDLDDAARFMASRRLVRAAPCYMPWYRINVLADGTLAGCAKTRKSTRRLGNVREASLADLWSAKPYRVFRRACATTGVFPKLPGCERCCVHVAQRNVDLHEIVRGGAGVEVIHDRKGFPRHFLRPWKDGSASPVPSRDDGGFGGAVANTGEGPH